MDSEAYWAARAEEIEKHWRDMSQKDIEKLMGKYYRESLSKIRDDIAILYARFAADNELTMEEARQLLKGPEYREWRMSMREYISAIEATDDKGLLRELNTLAMRSRITRLDKLFSETLRELDRLGRKVRRNMHDFLSDAYKDGYYRGRFEIGHAGVIQDAATALDNAKVERVLRMRWSGENYSQRLWDNTRKLQKSIRETVLENVHRGVSVQKLSAQIEERMKVGHNQAIRLVRTETNFALNQAALDSIKDAGMLYYKFIATLDKRTSSICRRHDGEIFPVSDAKSGSNIPPLHPHCRSTISGSLRGEDVRAHNRQRIARDGDSNKNMYVPADMTYSQWYQKYIARGSRPEEIFARHDLENGIIKVDKPSVKGPPNGVTLVVTKKGGKTWNFYDENGLQYLQVSDNDHGHKKESKFGKHGEHAHEYTIGPDGIPHHGPADDIPSYVRKALGDEL